MPSYAPSMRSGAGWCAKPARPSINRRVLALIAAPAGAAGAAMAQDSEEGERVPSFAELEAVGRAHRRDPGHPNDVFDLTDPAENNWLFRLANKLHIQTRPEVIRRLLLFKTGDPVSVQAIEETERLLRAKHYLYEVSIQPVSHRDGVADIEVKTRDTWSSTSASASAGRVVRTKAASPSRRTTCWVRASRWALVHVRRRPPRLRGQYVRHQPVRNARRRGLFVRRLRRRQQPVIHPAKALYALDARWGAGISAAENNQLTSQYNAGNQIAEYRVRSKRSRSSGGWSPGLIAGWATRYSAGALTTTRTTSSSPASRRCACRRT